MKSEETMTAEGAVAMRTEGHVTKWLEGAAVPCVVCGEMTTEGGDECGHYDRFGFAVWEAAQRWRGITTARWELDVRANGESVEKSTHFQEGEARGRAMRMGSKGYQVTLIDRFTGATEKLPAIGEWHDDRLHRTHEVEGLTVETVSPSKYVQSLDGWRATTIIDNVLYSGEGVSEDDAVVALLATVEALKLSDALIEDGKEFMAEEAN